MSVYWCLVGCPCSEASRKLGEQLLNRLRPLLQRAGTTGAGTTGAGAGAGAGASAPRLAPEDILELVSACSSAPQRPEKRGRPEVVVSLVYRGEGRASPAPAFLSKYAPFTSCCGACLLPCCNLSVPYVVWWWSRAREIVERECSYSCRPHKVPGQADTQAFLAHIFASDQSTADELVKQLQTTAAESGVCVLRMNATFLLLGCGLVSSPLVGMTAVLLDDAWLGTGSHGRRLFVRLPRPFTCRQSNHSMQRCSQ